MNITYKEYKEKLKIELDEFKEKLKSNLDEFKAKQNKKLENFKLKNSKKNKRSSKRKIKGGDLTPEEINTFNNIILDFIFNKNIAIKNKELISDKTEIYQLLFNDLIKTNNSLFSIISQNDYDSLLKLNKEETYKAIVNQLKEYYKNH
jgi:hypothetical protein